MPQVGRSGPELTRDALLRLEQAPWPGNVRQLRSAIERWFVLNDLETALEPAAQGASELDGPLEAADYREARRLFETAYITRKLREHGGNVTRTAAAIGLERQSLQEKIRQLGISRRGPEDLAGPVK